MRQILIDSGILLSDYQANEPLHAAILSLDSDFDVYRRFRRQPFQRVPLQP